MKWNDEGLSEVLDSTLIIALGLVLAGIIAAFVFGVFTPVDKTAYLVPRFSIANVSGHSVIMIFDRGGDPVYFNGSPQAKYKAALYVDTQSGSSRAVPAPSLTVLKPGDTIYAYYTGTGFILTNTLAGVTFPSLPSGKIAVRFIDVTSGTLIAKEDLVPAATTATATIATTTTTTATTITTTTTTPPVSLAANFTVTQTGTGGKEAHFTDTSTGVIKSWLWNFGDGTSSTKQHSNNNYRDVGSYDVTLTITGSDGATSSVTKRVTVTKN